jgi:hypothetical protein
MMASVSGTHPFCNWHQHLRDAPGFMSVSARSIAIIPKVLKRLAEKDRSSKRRLSPGQIQLGAPEKENRKLDPFAAK